MKTQFRRPRLPEGRSTSREFAKQRFAFFANRSKRSRRVLIHRSGCRATRSMRSSDSTGRSSCAQEEKLILSGSLQYRRPESLWKSGRLVLQRYRPRRLQTVVCAGQIREQHPASWTGQDRPGRCEQCGRLELIDLNMRAIYRARRMAQRSLASAARATLLCSAEPRLSVNRVT
jgi:hypothetical protein